jgi:ketosteroid isomerase-like protein
MSKSRTPEEFLSIQVQEFNNGNIDFLKTLYESDACLAVKPDQVVKGLENIRKGMRGFIDMRAKLEARVKRVLQANELILMITEWSINGTEPDGKPINFAASGNLNKGFSLRSQPSRKIMLSFFYILI